MSDGTTRLRALLKRAALPACEAYRDDDIGTWHVRRVEGGDCVAEVAWCGHEPLVRRGATEARAQLFAAIPTALPTLLDAAERAERAEAIIAGRTTPPTDEELAAHERATGLWRVRWAHLNGGWDHVETDAARRLRDANNGKLRWWPLDADGCPCAWPTAVEQAR